LPGNLRRSLPDGCGAAIDAAAWPVPPLFRLLQDAGRVATDEMFHVFNMGIGMVAVVPPDGVDPVRQAAGAAGVDTWVVGDVVPGDGVHIG
jgi:phosphoribosylformylglycinamidine cyclo-ligase